MRGEYKPPRLSCGGNTELPPRARRILHQINPYTGEIGTTSACAENTDSHGAHAQALGNYLRVRGEYSIPLVVAKNSLELPPRARRIRELEAIELRVGGTTSACAENTQEMTKVFL